jgi:hypothetical protein
LRARRHHLLRLGCGLTLVSASGALIVLGLPAAAGASQAGKGRGPAPQCGLGGVIYSVGSAQPKFIPDPDKIATGRSGVTLKIDVATGTTWTGTVGGSGSFDVSAIIASAQASVDASISYSRTTTTDMSGSWTVPSNQSWGWLALGAMGYTMDWYKYAQLDSCKYDLEGSGVAQLPARSPAFDHS